jgi:hypothetical protein
MLRNTGQVEPWWSGHDRRRASEMTELAIRMTRRRQQYDQKSAGNWIRPLLQFEQLLSNINSRLNKFVNG